MLACVRVSRPRADWKLSAITLLACFIFSDSLRAQAPQPPVPPPVTQESAVPKLPPEALNQLLAPVALYPDALIALILPASTAPSDVVLAARYLSSNGDPAQVANQPWDESVKSLVRYPDVLKWMDQNLEWTTQVGVAFLDQPADVMNAIQQLRAQAIAAGNLVDCPQQKIVKEETCVRIVPAEPELIYVPRYDPEVVYVRPYEPYLGPALTFGVGFAVGSWLNYDCDWPRRQGVCGRLESGMEAEMEAQSRRRFRSRADDQCRQHQQRHGSRLAAEWEGPTPTVEKATRGERQRDGLLQFECAQPSGRRR